jgi:hypothetical protein
MEQHWKEFEKGYMTNILTDGTYKDYTNIIKTEGSIERFDYRNVKKMDRVDISKMKGTDEIVISEYFKGTVKFKPIKVSVLKQYLSVR